MIVGIVFVVGVFALAIAVVMVVDTVSLNVVTVVVIMVDTAVETVVEIVTVIAVTAVEIET